MNEQLQIDYKRAGLGVWGPKAVAKSDRDFVIELSHLAHPPFLK
jgi:hypothetical protein